MAVEGPAPAKKRFVDWIEASAKVVGAVAMLVIAVFANSLQGRLTGISIQSQREQAESQLRANMFNSLIGPIAGPQTTWQRDIRFPEQAFADHSPISLIANKGY